MTDSLDRDTWKLSAFAVRERECANAREAERQAVREARRQAEREKRLVDVDEHKPAPVPFQVRRQVSNWMQKFNPPRPAKRIRTTARGR